MNNDTDVVCKLCEELSVDMAQSVVNSWFTDLEVESFANDRLVLHSPADFKRDVISSKYVPALSRAAKHIFGRDIDVSIAQVGGVKSRQPVRRGPEQRRYSFDEFVVGESNKYAYSAASAVAKSPGKAYNPLFLYGGSGLGKTHLLHAIKDSVRRNNPGLVVLAVTAEAFTGELATAIQTKTTKDFKERYRTPDLLLIDDIQFIARSEFSQEEIFHTFNAMYDAQNQIVITSDRPPRELQAIENRLRTRFEWGLITDISPPDFETRIAIIQSKSQRLGLILPREVIELAAESITTNVRQIEGMVNKLKAERDLMGKSIDVEMAGKAIADLMRENPGFNPTPMYILEEVCKFYNLEPSQITGKSRKGDIVRVRQIAMYLIRTMTSMSLENIGHRIFLRDHTTVLHAVKKVEEHKEHNPAFNNDIKAIIENIKGN
ncbi:MAG: chromosomal replication initiator protein DnaA [Oscillospiraceae bacterium]|nr:chromosomal replication initiator protein DnaA [Oscillospiraceae bacterium]